MSESLYLDMLDQSLRSGLIGLSEAFVDAQVGFVVSCQQADGGFRGRQGDSDFYYTDFALRTLALLAPEHVVVQRAANYITHPPRPPRDTVECFNVLNSRRLLNRVFNTKGTEEIAGKKAVASSYRSRQSPPSPFASTLLLDQLRECVLPCGGFARFVGDGRVSAYHTFLGQLCLQMLGIEMPDTDRAITAIEALQQSDGGFAELADQTASQTSATAAAVAFLMMHDALSSDKTSAIARFLADMQTADGGLKPHAAIETGDLLSTFTGLMTLSALDGLHLIDLASIAQFLRSVAHHDGGFFACVGDDAADVEYTHYGICTLALLRIAQG